MSWKKVLLLLLKTIIIPPSGYAMTTLLVPDFFGRNVYLKMNLCIYAGDENTGVYPKQGQSLSRTASYTKVQGFCKYSRFPHWGQQKSHSQMNFLYCSAAGKFFMKPDVRVSQMNGTMAQSNLDTHFHPIFTKILLNTDSCRFSF